MRKKIITIIVIFVSFFIMSTSLYAQEDFPGGPGGDTDVPLDDGSYIFVAVGVAYGIKSMMDKKKKSSVDKEDNYYHKETNHKKKRPAA